MCYAQWRLMMRVSIFICALLWAPARVWWFTGWSHLYEWMGWSCSPFLCRSLGSATWWFLSVDDVRYFVGVQGGDRSIHMLIERSMWVWYVSVHIRGCDGCWCWGMCDVASIDVQHVEIYIVYGTNLSVFKVW